MARILFFDTEGNSLDTAGGFIQELAWAIFDLDSGRLLKCTSHLLKWNMHYEVAAAAFEVTGLSREFCEEQGKPAGQVFEEFLLDCENVDCVAGHNIIDYDVKMAVSNIKRALFGAPVQLTSKFTFDTMYDCPYPKHIKVLALEFLALKHGYVMTDAHKAMADVFATAHIFFKYPIDQMIEIARTPIVTVAGYTQFLDTAGREAFYTKKFRWNRDRKRWEKTCRAFYVEGIQLDLKYDLFVNDLKLQLELQANP